MSPARKSSELALFSHANVVPHFSPHVFWRPEWTDLLESWFSTLDGVHGIIIVPESHILQCDSFGFFP